MSITTVGNQLIHYEVLGRGKPLIFIHGWLGSWRYWWPSMQALSAQHRSFAFDLWGFGDSSKAPDMYSLQSYTEMLDQFISRLGISRPVTLVGHSLGAAVALEYTTKNPDSVQKLVTVSLPVQGEHIDRRLTALDAESFIKATRSDNFSEVNAETRKTDTSALHKLAGEMLTSNFAPNLVECPRPLLMVFGGDDTIVNPPSGDYYHLQKNGDNRFYVSLDNCQHFPMLQEKAKFNRLLLDFFHKDNVGELAPKEHWQRRTR